MPNTLRVLIVDDLADAVESMAMVLRAWGHEVLTATDGAKAIILARRFASDVVLCDLAMPDVTGLDVARCIKPMPGLERTYLIAVTGFGSDEDRAKAKAAGFDCYLLKPVDPDELRQLLAVLASRANR
jgi:CheY-like chemotaxis protein